MKKIFLIHAVLLSISCKHQHPQTPAEVPAAARQPQRVQHDFKFIGYDPPSRTLSIQFNDGSRSNFAGVGEAVYYDFMRAAGKMVFFTNNIQGLYESKPAE